MEILNGDEVRNEFNDFDFSYEGRIRQSNRMHSLAEKLHNNHVILDFVCPMRETRTLVDPDFVVFVDVHTNDCPYEDTKALFEYPYRGEYDVRVLSWSDAWVDFIVDKISKLEKSY